MEVHGPTLATMGSRGKAGERCFPEASSGLCEWNWKDVQWEGALIPRGLGAVVRLGGPEDGPEAGLVSEAWPAGGGRWVSRMAAQHVGGTGPRLESGRRCQGPWSAGTFSPPGPGFGPRLKPQATCTRL